MRFKLKGSFHRTRQDARDLEKPHQSVAENARVHAHLRSRFEARPETPSGASPLTTSC